MATSCVGIARLYSKRRYRIKLSRKNEVEMRKVILVWIAVSAFFVVSAMAASLSYHTVRMSDREIGVFCSAGGTATARKIGSMIVVTCK